MRSECNVKLKIQLSNYLVKRSLWINNVYLLRNTYKLICMCVQNHHHISLSIPLSIISFLEVLHFFALIEYSRKRVVIFAERYISKSSGFFRRHIIEESQKSSDRPPNRRYYRTLSGHMEFGPENSPVQEIANDLNVRAAHWDRKSYGPSCDGWTRPHSVIWRRFMCALTRTPSMILHMSQLSSDITTGSHKRMWWPFIAVPILANYLAWNEL